MHKLGVIFDVDGVLVDSYHAHYASWRVVAEADDVAFSQQDFAATFGRTSRDIIALLWPPGAAVAEIDERKEAAYRDIIAADFPAMPGAAALIDTLSAEGFALAVGSSGPPENVELVLERLGRRERFNVRITGKDVTRGKPDPQVFALAGERLGIEPGRCVVIEDAPAGVAAAHAAGMKCIGLASTGRTTDELRKADVVVQSLDAITAAMIRDLLGH